MTRVPPGGGKDFDESNLPEATHTAKVLLSSLCPDEPKISRARKHNQFPEKGASRPEGSSGCRLEFRLTNLQLKLLHHRVVQVIYFLFPNSTPLNFLSHFSFVAPIS